MTIQGLHRTADANTTFYIWLTLKLFTMYKEVW